MVADCMLPVEYGVACICPNCGPATAARAVGGATCNPMAKGGAATLLRIGGSKDPSVPDVLQGPDAGTVVVRTMGAGADVGWTYTGGATVYVTGNLGFFGVSSFGSSPNCASSCAARDDSSLSKPSSPATIKAPERCVCDDLPVPSPVSVLSLAEACIALLKNSSSSSSSSSKEPTPAPRGGGSRRCCCMLDAEAAAALRCEAAAALRWE